VAAHGYGPNALRLEFFLSRLTTALGCQGVFHSTPNEIHFAFSKEGELWQRTHWVALPGTGLDLAKLAKVGELVDAVEAGQISLPTATSRLDEIDKMRPPWGNVANAVSYAGIGSGFAVLLSGGWWDVLLSALFSLVVYGMALQAARCGGRVAEWLPLSTAFMAGVLAAFARILLPEINVVLVVLSAILVLIPGYSISTGVIELTYKHSVSGMANLMSGLVYLAKQFAGAWLGVRLVEFCGAIPKAASGSPIHPLWLWLFLPMLILGLCVVFQTSWRDLLWAAGGCAIAYLGIRVGSFVAGANLGNLLGTTLVVVFANLWAGKAGRPTSIVLLPAIVLLVSGSIGFRGLAAMASGQVAAGEQQLLQMFVVALTIAAGLMVGNTLVRPKTTL
jgi:uncharacterized membrane protein YjjP (DUF1212 family)